jgi:hypothetical protein
MFSMFKLEQISIALSRKDGGVSIMAFLTVGRGSVLPFGAQWLEDGWWVRPPTDANISNEIRAIPEGPDIVSWVVITPDQIPSGDRTYRDAWTLNGKMIEHDMVKAREVHRGRVRKARAAALKTLDGEWMRAIGQSQQIVADEVERKRKAWRDAPTDPRIDAAQTVGDLKALS